MFVMLYSIRQVIRNAQVCSVPDIPTADPAIVITSATLRPYGNVSPGQAWGKKRGMSVLIPVTIIILVLENCVESGGVLRSWFFKVVINLTLR